MVIENLDILSLIILSYGDGPEDVVAVCEKIGNLYFKSISDSKSKIFRSFFAFELRDCDDEFLSNLEKFSLSGCLGNYDGFSEGLRSIREEAIRRADGINRFLFVGDLSFESLKGCRTEIGVIDLFHLSDGGLRFKDVHRLVKQGGVIRLQSKFDPIAVAGHRESKGL